MSRSRRAQVSDPAYVQHAEANWISDWINNFIIGLITPPLVQNTGFGAYVFFAVFCLLSGVWTFFFVPETNGKTLEQMDDVFRDRDSTEEVSTKQRLFEETRREKEGAVAVSA